MKENKDDKYKARSNWYNKQTYRLNADLKWFNFYNFKPIGHYFDFWELTEQGKIIGD